MSEKSEIPFIIQNRNPNLPERSNLNIESLLPSVNLLLNQVREKEIPNAMKSESYKPLTEAEIKDNLKDSMQKALAIEKAARNPNRWDIPWDTADNTTLIIDFSAPGTYMRAKKDDRFAAFDWSWGMDRKRADTAALLGIQMAGLATGNDFSEFTQAAMIDNLNPKLSKKRDVVRQSLFERGVRFLYLGTKEEANAIRQVIASRKSFIPSDLVIVIDEDIDNTFDQVKAIKKYLTSHMRIPGSPDGFIPPKSNIIIPMGLQAIRALPMLRQIDAIPKGLTVSIFPIATPAEGIKERAALEAKGRIFYTLTGKAHKQSITYTLLGQK